MKNMLIPALIALAVVLVLAFLLPKLMYERGAGTPTPTPIEAYSKKCFGFEKTYQKGEGGMVKHYCLGIAYEAKVRVVETGMFKDSGAEALSVTFVPKKRELEFTGLQHTLYQDEPWDIRNTDTYFDPQTGTFFVKLILMKSKPAPEGMMVDMSLFFTETVSVPEGASKVLFGSDEADITSQIEGWKKSSGRVSEQERAYASTVEESPSVVKICKEAPFDVAVTEYKNDAGEMGGYFAEYNWKPGTDMMNHPPAYLYDSKGERTGTADFYNSEGKNNEFNSAHDKLKKEFPVTRKVKCT